MARQISWPLAWLARCRPDCAVVAVQGQRLLQIAGSPRDVAGQQVHGPEPGEGVGLGRGRGRWPGHAPDRGRPRGSHRSAAARPEAGQGVSLAKAVAEVAVQGTPCSRSRAALG